MPDIRASDRGAGAPPVLQLFRSLEASVGGPLSYLLVLAEALRGAPATLQAAALEPRAAHVPMALAFQGSGPAGPIRAAQLARWLRARAASYVALHVHGIFGWHALLAHRACERARRCYVISPHGHLQAAALHAKGLKKRAYLAVAGRRILRDAAAVVAASELERDAVLAVEPRARVRVIPPGVAVPEQVPARTGGLRQLLFVGRLHPHKRIDVLLQALARMPRGASRPRLVIAGAGDPAYAQVLRGMAAGLGLADAVEFTGHVDGARKRELLGKSDLFVLPSLSENFSFATAEALAAGLPAIVTDQVGLAAAIARHTCGAVVPSGDSAALAAAISALAPPALLAEASRRAHACAREELSLVRMRAAMLELYAVVGVVAA